MRLRTGFFMCWRHAVAPLVACALFVGGIFAVVLPRVEASFLQYRREMARQILQASWPHLQNLEQRRQNGELTLADAQTQAIAYFRSLRYGSQGQDYCWIVDTAPQMVMHPFRHDLEGVDIAQINEPHIVEVFEAIVLLGKRDGEGFLDYSWQWLDDSSRIEPKTTYLRMFEPWGWIVGSGIYLNDLVDELAQLRRDALQTSLLILMAVVIVLGFVVFQSIRAWELLRKAKLFSETVIETSPACIVAVDAQNHVILANDALLNATGFARQDVIGTDIMAKLVPPELREEVAFFLHMLYRSDIATPFRSQIVAADQSRRDIEWYCRRVCNVDKQFLYGFGVGIDITEQLRTEAALLQSEAQLRRSETMNAVGRLAGGVAHDFNNMLGVITGNIELLLLDANLNADERQRMHAILRAAEQSAQLVRKLLSFSRTGKQEIMALNLVDIVYSTADIVRKTLPTGVQLLFDVQTENLGINGDAGELHAALLNLILNSCDAMPDGGVIEVGAAVTFVDAPLAARFPVLKRGKFAMLSVRDNGTGIDSATLKHIFEPFFTTKAPGKGTGLGLAGVFGCMQTHHGAVDVESTPGSGTVFRLYFPLADLAVGEDATVETMPDSTRRLLIVDDEMAVRKVVAENLRVLGYDVCECESGDAALARCAGESGFDLVVLDMLMPGMNGYETFHKLKAQNPGLPVLMASGFWDEAQAQQLLAAGLAGWIRKPIRIAELSAKIAQLLAALPFDHTVAASAARFGA